MLFSYWNICNTVTVTVTLYMLTKARHKYTVFGYMRRIRLFRKNIGDFLCEKCRVHFDDTKMSENFVNYICHKNKEFTT